MAPGIHNNLHASLGTGLWNSRLGHPREEALRRILISCGFSYSKSDKHSCHACRLGKHVRLPFTESNNISSFPFQLLHCDLWTSPIPSNSGFQFYLVILDDYSHFAWTSLYVTNLMFFQTSFHSMHSFALNSAVIFNAFRQTTGASSTTRPLARSSLHMASPFA